MLNYLRILIVALSMGFAMSQAPSAHAGDIFKKLGKKLEKKKKKKAAKEKAKAEAPKEKPLENTPTGFGKGEDLVISIDRVTAGTCKRGTGATAFKLSVSAILWTRNPQFGSERVGPVEIYSEEIAALNPKQTFTGEDEIRIPIDQINAAFEELGYSQFKADKAEVVASTLGIGLDPVGPCSKLNGQAYMGYSFVTPTVFLYFPNPFHKNLGAGFDLISRKGFTATVLDNDSGRLGETQGSATKTTATITVGVAAQ